MTPCVLCCALHGPPSVQVVLAPGSHSGGDRHQLNDRAIRPHVGSRCLPASWGTESKCTPRAPRVPAPAAGLRRPCARPGAAPRHPRGRLAVQPHVQVRGYECETSAELPEALQQECGAVFCGNKENFKDSSCTELADMHWKCLGVIKTQFESTAGGYVTWIETPTPTNRGWMEAMFRVLPGMESQITVFKESKDDGACTRAP